MTIGSILAATDPVAVVGALKALKAPEKLSNLIKGESLLNDGSSFVLFVVFLDLAMGVQRTLFESVVYFLLMCLGGATLGLVAGCIMDTCLYLCSSKL